jgi:UDP-N-acetyl-2-amino-2-deoxyglucuronate dehydrogenase
MTGVAGYIAPRHLKAIKDTGNDLIAAMDPHDSVGILDSYFPKADYFREIERFERHLERLKHNDKPIDYISICSPNHLHDAHIRLAMRLEANAICEKPLVLNPWNLDLLESLESGEKKRIFTLLQLRVHPALVEFKNNLKFDGKKKEVELTYITSRGSWYHFSWKGDNSKSGGVVTNIGVHFYDLLIWLFGKPVDSQTYLFNDKQGSGFIELENANVRWFLSIDENDLPADVREKSQRTYRSISVDGNELEFSGGFTDLHTRVYEETLKGNGFTISDTRASIELVHKIRTDKITTNIGCPHRLLRQG